MGIIADRMQAIIDEMKEQDRQLHETIDAMVEDARQAIEALDRIDQETGDWL